MRIGRRRTNSDAGNMNGGSLRQSSIIRNFRLLYGVIRAPKKQGGKLERGGKTFLRVNTSKLISNVAMSCEKGLRSQSCSPYGPGFIIIIPLSVVPLELITERERGARRTPLCRRRRSKLRFALLNAPQGAVAVPSANLQTSSEGTEARSPISTGFPAEWEGGYQAKCRVLRQDAGSGAGSSIPMEQTLIALNAHESPQIPVRHGKRIHGQAVFNVIIIGAE